jgi:hypothetical protein
MSFIGGGDPYVSGVTSQLIVAKCGGMVME